MKESEQIIKELIFEDEEDIPELFEIDEKLQEIFFESISISCHILPSVVNLCLSKS